MNKGRLMGMMATLMLMGSLQSVFAMGAGFAPGAMVSHSSAMKALKQAIDSGNKDVVIEILETCGLVTEELAIARELDQALQGAPTLAEMELPASKKGVTNPDLMKVFVYASQQGKAAILDALLDRYGHADERYFSFILEMGTHLKNWDVAQKNLFVALKHAIKSGKKDLVIEILETCGLVTEELAIARELDQATKAVPTKADMNLPQSRKGVKNPDLMKVFVWAVQQGKTELVEELMDRYGHAHEEFRPIVEEMWSRQ